MKTVTSKQLERNLSQLLDEVLETGQPIEVLHHEKRLKIIAVSKGKLQNLLFRPKTINGNPDDLVSISWTFSSKLE